MSCPLTTSQEITLIDSRSTLRNVILRISKWTGRTRHDRSAGTGRAHVVRGILVSALLFGAAGATFAAAPAYASSRHVTAASHSARTLGPAQARGTMSPDTVFIFGQPVVSPQTVFIFGQPDMTPQTVFIF